MFTFLGMMLIAFLINALLLVFLWALGRKLSNYGIVDVAWSLLVLIDSLLFTITLPGSGLRKFTVSFLLLVWALRLSFQIFYRLMRHPTQEDARYSALRAKWAQDADASMLRFYLIQGLGAMLFSLPAYFVSRNPAPGLGLFEIIASVIFLAATAGETLADFQLARFKADPANKGLSCRAGLWAWSRHPNYFFEWLIWCSLFLFSLGSPFGWISVICPAAMYHFLNNVTGIPLAEAQALQSRPEDYRRYQEQVSRFFPRAPKPGH